jgi:hypothetical protein
VKVETFKREASGIVAAWLKRIWEVNADARAKGKPEPFSGRPTIRHNREDYASGASVVFTGETGNGTVTLSWGE